MAVFKEFENTMKEIQHFYCDKCKCVSLNLKKTRGEEHVCEQCDKNDANYGIKHNLLPIWYDENEQPHYELPPKLCGLYDSEKMLIQKCHHFFHCIM